LLATALAVFVAVKLWQRHTLIRELRSSRISVGELKELVDRGPPPVIVDARAATVPFDAEVIVYCACPNEASAARIAQQLIRMGCIRVRPLTGGIFAWKDAGFDVEAISEPEVMTGAAVPSR